MISMLLCPGRSLITFSLDDLPLVIAAPVKLDLMEIGAGDMLDSGLTSWGRVKGV